MKYILPILMFIFLQSISANDSNITVTGTVVTGECRFIETQRRGYSSWAEGCPAYNKAQGTAFLKSRGYWEDPIPPCNLPDDLPTETSTPEVPEGYDLISEEVVSDLETPYPAYNGATTVAVNGRAISGYCYGLSAGITYDVDIHGGFLNTKKIKRVYEKTCQLPNTDYPKLASNEIVPFTWKEDNDRSNECTQTYSGKVQSRIVNCETEYRCVVETEKDPDDDRCEPINSYVLPTARVFHEDIALVGTNIGLHYQSDYLSNESIARGWSLDTHHILDGDYLHLGSGKLLNISSYKSVENNTTTISLGEVSYIFNELNQHIATKDNFTNKTLYTFTYSTNNKLISIADSFNNTTTLQRDVNDIVTSITAPHGQINYIYVDENNDLINVTYEDNSNYTFTYENHLMLSEIEPNGNEFIHQFDENGKIVKVIDAVNGIWSFSNTSNDTYTETKVTKADGDEIIYQDYFLENGSMVTKTTIASTDTFNSSSSVDGTTENSNVCGVERTISYQTDKDPITHKRVPNSIIITQPSGLSKTTNYSQNYTLDGETLLSKQTTTTINEATTTTNRDYANSTMTITSPEGRVTTVEYDKDTNLPTKLQVANLRPVIYKYDEEGRVIKIEQGPRKVKYTYDERGNIKEEINLQRDTTTSYEYDQKDRVIKTTYPDGSIVAFAYDKNNNRVRLTTPSPTDHTFEYNGVNKRTSMASPLGYKTLYSYDKQRRVTEITRPSGKSITNTYEAGRLKEITTDDGVTEYEYSCNDKISSISNDTENISYSYDGDLLTQINSQGILSTSINYTYNNNFLPISIEYGDSTTNYTYDKDGFLTSSGEFTLTRDSLNAQVTNITDGVFNQELTYNEFGEISTKNSENFQLTLKRDEDKHHKHMKHRKGSHKNRDSKIAHKEELVVDFIEPRMHHRKKANKHFMHRIPRRISKTVYDYTYDDRGRLTTVRKNHRLVEKYTYDANGNRLQATVNGVTTTASYTLDDNLEVYGDNTYNYDEDGYLVEKTTPNGTTTYTYNTQGALTSITTPTKTIIYHLNPLNQRVAKEVNGVVTEKYLWANLTTLLAIYDKDDNLIQRFNYIDSRMPISMTQDNQTYYLHYNQVATLRAVTDKNQNIIKEITYDTFGNILQDTNPNFKIPFGFAGGLQDRDTNLVHFGYREYDPYTGKWTAKDPIDFGGGDSNLYGYVLQDPVNLVDPTGEFAFAAVPIYYWLAGVGVAAGGATALQPYVTDALNDWWNEADVYCAGKDSKRMSNKRLGEAAKNNGYKDAHDMKNQLGLDSNSDIFVDKNGDMYSGGTKGNNRPLDPLGHNENGD